MESTQRNLIAFKLLEKCKILLKKMIIPHTSPQEKNEVNTQDIINYLTYEVSDLRAKVRYLLAESNKILPNKIQTKDSFDYQWKNLLKNEHLLDSKSFRQEVSNLICAYTGLPKEWFKNKKVLDAGCGQGRFSYGFAKLGANVLGIDQSSCGIEYAKKACKIFENAYFEQCDLLEPLHFEQDYDLVWSYGVLHHTGNTFKGFQHISKLVKPGGYIFLMLYGEPRFGKPDEFYAQAEYSRLRRKTLNKSYEEKIKILLNEKPKEQLHGWFDAISPSINDTYSYEEVETWLLNAGFEGIHRTNNYDTLHIIARKEVVIKKTNQSLGPKIETTFAAD